MNRLAKILTLGLERKRAWQLPIIAGLLVLFGLGVRWWYNSRAAKGIRLLDMVDINDVEGVRWISRWDKEQVNRVGKVSVLTRHFRRKPTFGYIQGPFLEWPLLEDQEFTQLHLATIRKHIRIVVLLIEAGADVNAKDKYGWTPLHRAARHGHIEVVKLLLEAGADVNAKGEFGETPLYRAAWRGRTEVVKLLLAVGAEVNDKDDEHGTTPLHCAAWRGRTEAVEVLITAGAEVNAKDNAGATPLPLAAWYGYTEVVKILLKAGANVNAKEGWWWSGRTALHRAAISGYTETAKVLLAAGAEVNAKDKDGETPLDMTTHRATGTDPKKQDEYAELLRKHGAKTGDELDAEAKQGKGEKE